MCGIRTRRAAARRGDRGRRRAHRHSSPACSASAAAPSSCRCSTRCFASSACPTRCACSSASAPRSRSSCRPRSARIRRIARRRRAAGGISASVVAADGDRRRRSARVLAAFAPPARVQDRIRGDRRHHRGASSCSAARAGGSATTCRRGCPDDRLRASGIGLVVLADGGERRLDVHHDADALRQADPSGGRDLGRARRADHDRGHARLHAGRPAAAGADAAVLDRLRVADRRCPDGAGVELTADLWRAARALRCRSAGSRSRSAFSCCSCRCDFSRACSNPFNCCAAPAGRRALPSSSAG